MKLEADASERKSDFAKVAELRYGKIPELERQLKLKENRLEEKAVFQNSPRRSHRGRYCRRSFQVDGHTGVKDAGRGDGKAYENGK